MKKWLFRILFPQLRRCETVRGSTARVWAKFRTLQRPPLDENEWVSKFVALDRDYTALEKEVAELRVENRCLKRDIRQLTS
jgi:hypothetical protein